VNKIPIDPKINKNLKEYKTNNKKWLWNEIWSMLSYNSKWF
jgi:hypothetical protein